MLQPGLMMDFPLTIPAILRRAAQVFPEKQIVSRLGDGSLHRYTYGDLYRRVVRLMQVLRSLGVQPGDRVATFAWNDYRHLELYFAVPSLGAVLHPLNIRLFPEQLLYIVQHAEDKFVFIDRSLACFFAEHQSALKTIQNYILMDDAGVSPTSVPTSALDYETLLAGASEEERFPSFDENSAASLCYTSGTTGEPKGVLYSHRSVYLHAMGCCMADSLGIREQDVVLPVVPMFHANAWGLPYACAMTGATQVLPGSHLLGRSLAELREQEHVTLAAGIPTIWNLLYQHLRQHPHDLSHLQFILSGGSAVPQSLVANFERDFGIKVVNAWGMTETSPVGSVARLKAHMEAWPPEDRLRLRTKQGLPVANIEMRIRNERGQELRRDGKEAGELEVRGPWVARSYYANAAADIAFTEDGWFRTGDIATLDAEGYMEITDRKKDVIKSRGEWISSVEMENALLSHSAILEAAVVGRPDALRGEAPVVYVVLRDPQQILAPQELLGVLSSRFARWQLPRLSDIHCVAFLPKTSVGKLDKKALRSAVRENPNE
jgi:fatty-acyl-CoA synthase